VLRSNRLLRCLNYPNRINNSVTNNTSNKTDSSISEQRRGENTSNPVACRQCIICEKLKKGKTGYVRERHGATHHNQRAADRNKTTYPRIMSQYSRYRVGVRPFIKNVKVSSFHSSHETSKSFHRVHLQNGFKCINCYTKGDWHTY
jgi:hypothetical protein